MLHLPTVNKENLGRYIDAGFPILYICTFEEETVDSYISAVADRREVLEWNGADGFVNFMTKVPLLPNQSLEATLTFLKTGKELDRKLLVIKDAAGQLAPNGQFKSDKVITLLREIARKIRREDLDTTIIIVSSILHIPQELEKLVTVLELGLPNEDEISKIIKAFVDKYEISEGPEEFREALSTALKGLSESEIKGLLEQFSK